MSKYHWLLDAGHGGVTSSGIYTTAPAKMHVFSDGFTILEGVINRAITKKVYEMLMHYQIDFSLVYDDVADVSLKARIKIAKDLHARRGNVVYVAIHSNAGGGKGFEVFTSPGQDHSDPFAEIFCKSYVKEFPEYPFRSDKADGDLDKEAKFSVILGTAYPSLLVENLFFDERKQAEFLTSEEGQGRIAKAIVNAIMECEAKL